NHAISDLRGLIDRFGLVKMAVDSSRTHSDFPGSICIRAWRCSMLRFACPSCGATLSAPEECAGRTSRCKCATTVLIPEAARKPQAHALRQDKTALGQLIGQVPTQVQPQRHGSPKGSAAIPDLGKTAVGPPILMSSPVARSGSHRIKVVLALVSILCGL